MGVAAAAQELPPVIVSGLGGSGTRVIAHMCQGLGVHMGDDLNSAADNLLFTLLFKRPGWLGRHGLTEPAPAVHARLALFAHLSHRPEEGRRSSALAALLGAAADEARRGVERTTAPRRARWAAHRVRAALRTQGGARGGAWGWKEPTAHLYLEHLARAFPGARYIHVLRDPRDYGAKPHNQPLLWSHLLGIPRPTDGREVTGYLLRYWATANSRAVELAPALGLPTHVVRLEELAQAPERGVRALASFLGRDLGPADVQRLQALVERHESFGRGSGLDLREHLGTVALEAVDRLGYAT